MLVAELDGQLLDFWVAKSEGRELLAAVPGDAEKFDPSACRWWHPDVYRPSSNWAQGGAVIANEWYEIESVLIGWFGGKWPYLKLIVDNPLKWFLRAFVASKFGDEVEDSAAIDILRSA